jgi:hypothetical protein
VVEAEHFGPFTIESLRALLTEVAGEEVTEDILGQLLAEETVKANIIDGVRRSVITKMGCGISPSSINTRTRFSASLSTSAC